MPNIQKQIDSLKAEITRLEKEQQKAEQQQKALREVSAKISSLLKESGISFESYLTHHIKRVSRIVGKLEAKNSTKSAAQAGKSSKTRNPKKLRRTSKPTITIKITRRSIRQTAEPAGNSLRGKGEGPSPQSPEGLCGRGGIGNFSGSVPHELSSQRASQASMDGSR